ncbi:type I glutamate--ammonia ligase [Phreatobacter aquaticus]|nr:glutamine synthetase family protein [Phreatobacter aquaticus]
MTTLVTTDYSGITRGRSILTSDFEADSGCSVGWVPANQSLTPFDTIDPNSIWGSGGDLRLKPDRDARYTTLMPGATTPLDMVMSDIVELDGTPWLACPRSFLKQALSDLHKETGLTLAGAFEHEFTVLGEPFTPAPAFSVQAFRRADPLGPVVMAALAEAGLKADTFIAEYGRDQFEVTVGPARGVAIADQAVALREIIREAARLRGIRTSFAPKIEPDTVGNGVHVHMSFVDQTGANALFDSAAPGRLSKVGAAFAAGIVRHMPALVAVTAPSVSSYMRLKPHNWSASYTWLGDQDREASLRICPTPTLGGKSPAKSFNIEFRACDATASPHLALGMLVRAGLEGIRARLPLPPIFSGDPEALEAAEREKLGLRRLPQSLPAALDCLEADPLARTFLAPKALTTYCGMKRTEIDVVAGLSPAELCARYAGIY